MSDAFLPCSICGEPAPAGGHTNREVTGWERARTQGGLHALVNRRETGRVACNVCILEMRTGMTPGQQHLI